MGLSQIEMANLLSISLSTYKRIINGKSGKLDDALKFAINYRIATGSSLMEAYRVPTRQHKLLYKLNKLTEKQLDAIETIVDIFTEK